MKKITRVLSLFLAIFSATIFAPHTAVVLAADTSLELTHPAGVSPRVFTEGWVFGAKCVAGGRDLSSQVKWSGTGTFLPNVGPISRPVFEKAGPNTIILSVTADGETITKQFSVTAVSPFDSGGAPLYAAIGDLALCEADVHSCPACPHRVKGPITNGSPNVTVRGKPAARVGDAGVHSACCGSNTYTISEGDPNVLIDGRPAARIGDETRHCGGLGKIIGAAKEYFVLFQLRLPTVREDRKPKKREGENAEVWGARRKAEVNALTYNDFVFQDMPLDKQLLVIKVSNDAKSVYPESSFTDGSKWSTHMKFTSDDLSTGESSLEGSILLIAKGTARTLGDLIAIYPVIQTKKDLKVLEFSTMDGIAQVSENNGSGAFGPITVDWSEQDKQDAVSLMKSILLIFDCFIAHAVYDEGDYHKIESFRRFRDETLCKTESGSRLIRLYYEYGPMQAIRLRENEQYRPYVKVLLNTLEAFISKLDTTNAAVGPKVDSAVFAIDKAVSLFYKEGNGEGLGRLVKAYLQ
jgi:uncharacterized Zn-binding protein involved in type VI secretion